MNRKIIGIFATEQEASHTIEALKNMGYSTDDISAVTRSAEEARKFEDETVTLAQEGATGGAATGGVVGGIGGLLAGLGALAIPGIGPLLAAGPIAATLAGAAVGAAGGGLIGGLIGLGIPEHEAKEYEAIVGEGRVLVIVDTEEANRSEIYRIFRDNHSLNKRYDEEFADLPQSAVEDSTYNETPAMGATNLEGNRMDGAPIGHRGLASPADLEEANPNDPTYRTRKSES
ncbi:general stress protein [Saccharibacillus sp. JS10]|uniref:general stress protein n=1 Tax=Saccharibacillus sp. JS10 TaxID=2950552 RepID=UPI00210897D9|nr:general stress protein [Saccharibacillus sp. JS10]MCQ4088350.1 general stress protein [Saccharibacillus sp. JS10]